MTASQRRGGLQQKGKAGLVGAGTAEKQTHNNTVAMHEALEKAGITSVSIHRQARITNGKTWRRSLHYLAPRLFR